MFLQGKGKQRKQTEKKFFGTKKVLDFLKNLCYNTYITKKGKWIPHKRKRCYL